MADITLSQIKGRRLCKVIGGKYNGKTLYLLDKRKKCCDDCSDRCKGNCCMDCDGGCSGGSNNIDNIHYLSLKDSGKFELMPTNDLKNSDVHFINGKRGAGKTYSLAELTKKYVKLFPKNNVYLFSKKPSDPLIDDLISKRIDLEQFIKDYNEDNILDSTHFPNNCFVIFDDIDMLNNDKPDKLRTKVFNIMNDLIQLSRDRNITVAQTSHMTTNREETKHALNGCSCFTFFYGAISPQIKNALKLYLGLSKENINRILKLKGSRSCTIFTTVPPVVMTEKEIIILDN